jgi:hypothetical protein
VLLLAAFVTLKATVYLLVLAYTCKGLFVVEYFPSPKLQYHASGDPVLLSLNVTANGALPVILLAVNAATGGLGAVTVI